jgi:hypothetical protein
MVLKWKRAPTCSQSSLLLFAHWDLKPVFLCVFFRFPINKMGATG